MQLIFCKLQSCHQFSNINLLYELFCCQLLEAPSQSLQEDYLCNLEKLHGMTHNFLLLCITWNRCCYLSGFDAAIIPVIWQQPNPRNRKKLWLNQSTTRCPDFKPTTNQTSPALISRELRNRDTIYKRNFKSRPSIDVLYYGSGHVCHTHHTTQPLRHYDVI